jgi:hypothetical protein
MLKHESLRTPETITALCIFSEKSRSDGDARCFLTIAILDWIMIKSSMDSVAHKRILKALIRTFQSEIDSV